MLMESMDLSEIPKSIVSELIAKDYLWKMYAPTDIESDLPFGQDYWKYIYWLPQIKKDFYFMAISSSDFNKSLVELCNKYGMDFWYFTTHYKDFIKTLEWMRKNNTFNHAGEVK